MSDRIIIIAVLGSTGSGKSTVAKHLEHNFGFTPLKFAQPLKDMLRALGLSFLDVEGPQSHRSKPHPLLLGKSARYAMQTLGTEWRNMIGRDLWANITIRRIKELIAQGETRFVIDDMRFPHELDLLGEIGCVTVAVRRRKVEPTPKQRRITKLPHFIRGIASFLTGVDPLHPSEALWFDMPHDIVIHNSGTVEDLRNDAAEALDLILQGKV